MQKEKKQKYQEMISIEEYLMKRRKQKEIEDRQFRQEESPAFLRQSYMCNTELVILILVRQSVKQCVCI